MLGAYEWAFVKPIRKLYYNITITLVLGDRLAILPSGGIEAIALIGQQFKLDGGMWELGDPARRALQQFGLRDHRTLRRLLGRQLCDLPLEALRRHRTRDGERTLLGRKVVGAEIQSVCRGGVRLAACSHAC